MLVIISDIHLTDGTSGQTVKAGAFRVFRDNLLRVVHNASENNGEINPPKSVEILLLGDIFDIIRSDTWEQSSVKPWSDNSSPQFLKCVDKIVSTIISHNSRSLKYLSDLSKEGIKVKVDDAQSIIIPVNIHYMAGNHDWFFHLPSGTLANEIRRKTVEAAGLSNDPGLPFAHKQHEGDETLKKVLKEHRVYAQHGDIYDSFNYDKNSGRNSSSLGDAIVVELLNGFPAKVRQTLNLKTDDLLAEALKELDNVRPLTDIPNWLSSSLKLYASEEQEKEVLKIWDEQVDLFLKTDFVRSFDIPWHIDDEDILELVLKASKWLNPATLGKLTNFFKNYDKSYSSYALNESSLLMDDCDYIVYGHTHTPEMTPLLTVVEDSIKKDKIYFNTGTFRVIHKKTIKKESIPTYVSYKAMHFVVIYKPHERKGRPFETWTGYLG
ncbi:MAG: metallophosphoesterase [Deltaproteobacteria bacterium]|nr:metallophosphoesterase [Deltaproteobacteria bacterium]